MRHRILSGIRICRKAGRPQDAPDPSQVSGAHGRSRTSQKSASTHAIPSPEPGEGFGSTTGRPWLPGTGRLVHATADGTQVTGAALRLPADATAYVRVTG